MENPATWGPLEKTIDAALRKAREDRAAGMVGLSEVRRVADAVRGLLDGPLHAAGFAVSEVRRIQGNPFP